MRNPRGIHTSVDSVLTLYDRRVDAWQELDEPWQVSLALAWEAYLAGTIPVGAVVVGPDGTIVARGRNRIFDSPGIGLAGSRLAHAEMDALSQLLVPRGYRDHVLYSTLEPCLLCAAATMHSTVGRIEYAAIDPYGGGCNGGIDTAHWRRSAPAIGAPLGGWVGRLSRALGSAFWLAHPDHPRASDILAHYDEDARKAGERIRAVGLPASFEDALSRLLDCL